MTQPCRLARTRVIVLVLLCHLWPASAWAAETLWGLTANNTLVRFSSTAPGVLLRTLPITGLPAGELIVAIEVDKWAGRLTCFSSAGRLYQVNRTTGAAMQLHPAAPIITPSGTAFGASDDFAGITIVSNSGSVVSIDATTGT